MESISSASAYALWSDMIVYHDERQVRDCLNDDDTRYTGTLASSTVLSGNLSRASGEIESACLIGGRYAPSDLATLNGVSQQALVGLCCDLAFWHLCKRRWKNVKPDDVPGTKEAYEFLQMLRQGERIFAFQETVDAEEAEAVNLETNSQGVQTDITDVARRFFGQRSKDFVQGGF